MTSSTVVPRFLALLDSQGVEHGSLFVQWNDPATMVANRSAFPWILADARSSGRVTVMPWLTRPFDALAAELALIQSAGDGIVLEAEVPAFRDGQPNPSAVDWQAVADRLRPYDVPKAVATSWTPFQTVDGLPSRSMALPLIEAGWYVLPYCYPGDAPQNPAGASVAAQTFYATHYGPEWSHAEPVLGLFGGYTLDSPVFDGWEDCPGASLWDAGTVI